MGTKRFTVIGGADDFLVTRRGNELWKEMAAGVDDDLGRETIDGAANNFAEVEAAVSSFIQAVNTLPMFGGRKVVWFKDITFLADSVTGRAEGTLQQVQLLREALEGIDPEQVGVLITAAPVDRRRSFWKWLESNSECEWFASGEKKGGTDLGALVRDECAREKQKITDDAVEQLIGKVNGNTRLLVEEIRKLATFLGGEGKMIDEALVAEMVPTFGEGDFFEAADAFFSLDLDWTLEALHRHFFAGADARGLITAMQNRNRLLIQLRVLLDSGEIRLGYRGIDRGSIQAAAERHAEAFGEAVSEKNAYNVFTQNPWYLGRLAETARKIPLKRLVEFQGEFLKSFEGIIAHPNGQEEVMREMTLRCLSKKEVAAG